MRWIRTFPILSPCVVLTHSFLSPLPPSVSLLQRRQYYGGSKNAASIVSATSSIHSQSRARSSSACRSFFPTQTTTVNANTQRQYHTSLRQTSSASWETEPLSTFVSSEDLPSNLQLAPTPEDVLTLQENQRLVCMGDIHGDASALLESLEIAGLIDADQTSNYRPGFPIYPTWTGGNTILVQIGDILDRGYYDLQCMQILCDLSHQAEQSGGKVICLLGNHEIMNVIGDFSYVAQDSNWMFQHAVGTLVDQTLPRLQYEQTKNAIRTPWRIQYHSHDSDRKAAFEPNGILSHSVLANMKVAVQVGRTLCVHAGLLPKHLNDYGGVSGINALVKSYIQGDFMKNVDFKFNNVANYENDIAEESFKHANERYGVYYHNRPEVLEGDDSPIFLREFSKPPNVQIQKDESYKKLEEVLQSNSCDRLVMGHTPQIQVNSIFGGMAWRIDTAMSSSVGRHHGEREMLEIVQQDGQEIVHVLTEEGKIPADERGAPNHSDLFL